MAGHDGSISFDVRLQKNDFFKGVEEIKKAIESLQSTAESIGRNLSSSATAYIRGVNKGVQSVSENVADVSNKSETFSGSLDSAAKSAEDLEKEIRTTQGVVTGTAESAVNLKNAFEGMSNSRSLVNTNEVKKTGVAFDELTRKAQRYQDIIAIEGRGSEAFKDLEKEIQKTENEIDKLTDQIDQMERAGVTEQNQGKYERLNKTLSQTKHEYGQLQQVREEAMQTPDLDSMSDSANEASTSLNRAANSATRFASKIASGALKTAVNTIKSMGSAAVRAATNLAKMVGGNVLSFLRKLAEGAKNAAVQLTKMVTSAVANGVKKLGTLAGKATKSLLGLNKASRGDGFKEGLKFLVRYGFGVRSLFMLYRKLRGAVVEAFENMAKKVPEVNKSLSRLASSFDLLKNSLATAFQPILTAVTPYLVQLMDMMSEAAAKVGEFFAVLTGQNYIYKATKANIDYAKSLDKSTKSTKKNTKETENQLASFDHLNILKENKDTGSSSDSDKYETPTADFKRVPIESAISDLARRIKDAFNKGDFTEIGKILANKLTEWVNEINWAWLGKKIGDGINHIVDVVNGFFDNFDWVDLGQKFAEGLNSLIDRVDFYELGRALTQKFRAMIDLLWGVVSRIDWNNLGQKIGDFLKGAFNNIPWERLGKLLGTLVTGAFTAIGKAIDKIDWPNFGRRLANGFNNLFGSIKWTKIADTLNKLFKGVLKALKTFITRFEWQEHATELKEGIKKFIKDVPVDGPDGLGEVMKTLIIDVLGFITTALGDPETWKEAAIKFKGFLNSVFGTGDDENGGKTVWDALEESLSTLLSGVLLFLGDVFGDEEIINNLGQKVGKFFNDLLTDEQLWTNLGTAVNKAMAGILTFGESFLKEFKPEDAATNIKQALRKIDWDGIATRTWSLAKLAFSKAGSFVDALFSESVHVDPEVIKNRSDPAYAKILNDEKAAVAAFNAQSVGTRIGAKISKALSNIPWAEIGKTMWENAKKLLANTGDFLSSLFNVTDDDVKNAGGNKALATGKKIGQLFADAIGKINWEDFGSTFSKLVTDLFDTINGFFQGINEDMVTLDNGQTVSKLEKAIIDFFGAIKWDVIVSKLWEIAKSAFTTLGQNAGSAIISGINESVVNAALGDNRTDLSDMLKPGVSPKQMDKDERGAVLAARAVFEKFEEEAKQAGYNSVQEYMDAVDGKADEISAAVKKAYVSSFEEEVEGPNGFDIGSGKTSRTGRLATGAADNTISELNAKEEEVKKAYEGTFVKTYEDGVEGSSGFDIGSGKSSRTGKLGIANVKNMSEGMDSEKHTLQRSLKGLVDESDSSWANAKRGQARELDSMSSKLSTSMREMTSTSSRETSEQERSITNKWSDVEREQSRNLNDMDRNLSDVMGSMTNTSDTETSNQAKPVYDNYGEIMVAVDECMRAARDYLIQYAGEMTDNLSYEMNSMGNLGWWVVGDAIIDGIADGIYNGWNWLNNTVWDLAYSLYNSAKNALGIHSPSKVFREGIGENVGLGIAEGILDTEPEIMDSVANLADLASETMNETDLGDFVNADGTGLVDGLDSVLDVFSNKVQNSFSDMLSKLNAIANTVTFRTPAIATGTVLPYAVSGGQTGGSKAVSDVVAKTNDEQTSALIQAFNNQTIAIVRAIEQYSTTNVNIDKKSLTDAVVEEINRRTRAAGRSPLRF